MRTSVIVARPINRLSLILLTALILIPIWSNPTSAETELLTPDALLTAEAANGDEALQAPLHPVMVEILELMETQDARISELEASLGDTADIHEVVRIHREIEKVKILTEVEMFRVQIRYAERRGASGQAVKLQEIVDDILERIETEEARRSQSQDTKN
ncbi:MAG: hypothetical protein GY835_07580 [bacterium]|nr:hypothetical protein [bacterium]